ncbi:shikimate dehydrogenase family protein [Anaeromyxobacter oryzae]|uniref:Shikimate dehydrogenase (NADP(+)) n=1 Tax=Anaeromyxobacter oryzae TaxID=2918170 RepID=A0ABM7WW79_9BACT|nr:shikimate dehydrogenase [Anaeromyxobacter oryzae]BDG03735.1 shikimate dehydrogenase (NADP(+)) [Anaeromyxobacter oryzae]
MITGRTALYGVVGHPVAHSRSPEMQNAAFADAGLDAVYVALPVPPDGLGDALRGAHALGFQGLNVTVPHKQRAASACVALDAVAEEVGAVNTLRRTAVGWEGFNTDAPACLGLLEASGIGAGARALLVGAGGAARAAGWALLRLGAEVRVVARRLEAAADLVHALGSAPARNGGRAQAVAWGELAAEADAADVVVNGTSVGLAGHATRLPALRFRPGQVALDFVYGETEFVRSASDAGARLVTGEQILVRQGALAFTLWTGRGAPEAVMTAALARPAAPSLASAPARSAAAGSSGAKR